MKKRFFLIVAMCIAMCSASAADEAVKTENNGTQWSWNKGTIEVKSPERPAGQKSVIGLALPKMPVVRVGFVGLGMRGPGAVSRFTHIPGTQVVALCDYEKSRADECQKYLKEASMPKAAVYWGEKGYEELCKRTDIDLVYIATDWLHHFPVAKCALENGKNVAIEVPSAMNLKECWALIDMSEKYRRHCMILENCCYDWFEMNTLNMAQHGVFGEIVRAQGAYIHNLTPYWKRYWKNGADDKLGWRLDYNMRYRGDVYPTHGLGPVAQALDIHRGDRMTTLVAMDTKSVVGKELVQECTDSVCHYFRNGDHTTTLIRTARGKVIEIQHNVMTPQPYNRLYQLTGTKGFANKYPVEGYALDAGQMRDSGVEVKIDDLTSCPIVQRLHLWLNIITRFLKNTVKWPKRWADMAEWISLWTAASCIACKTGCRSIWTSTTLPSGAVLPSLEHYRWIMAVPLWQFPISRAASGTRFRDIATLLPRLPMRSSRWLKQRRSLQS